MGIAKALRHGSKFDVISSALVFIGYSIPAYYGKGSKIYLVAKCNVIRNLDFWLRIAQTTYTDREILKSGWDEIEGNKMTEIKLQLRYKF